METKEIICITGNKVSKIPQICPHLKSCGDETVRFGFPHSNNSCYKLPQSHPIKLFHQESVCLKNTYKKCSVYQADNPLILPEEIRGRRLIKRINLAKIPILVASFLIISGLTVYFLGKMSNKNMMEDNSINENLLVETAEETKSSVTQETDIGEIIGKITLEEFLITGTDTSGFQISEALSSEPNLSDGYNIPVTGSMNTEEEAVSMPGVQYLYTSETGMDLWFFLKRAYGWSERSLNTEKVNLTIRNLLAAISGQGNKDDNCTYSPTYLTSP